jgi:predicted amidohydrolase
LTKARALENGIIVVFVNRVGIEDGLRFWGGSHVVNPNGEVLAKARYYDEDVVSLSLDLSDLEKTRPFIPTVRDLRTEVIDILRERSHQL